MSLVKSKSLVDQVITGTPAERKVALRALDDPELAAPTLNTVLPLLGTSPPIERHRASKIVRKVILSMGPECSAWAEEIIQAVQPMLLDSTYLVRKQGRELISSVAAAAGMPMLLGYFERQLHSENKQDQRMTAETLAALAPMGNIVPFLCAAARSHNSHIKGTALSSLITTCRLHPKLVLPNLPMIVAAVLPTLRELPHRSRACFVVAAAAEACSPFGIETLEKCLPALWAGVRSRGNLAPLVRALGSLIPLMDPDNAEDYTTSVLNLCLPNFETNDDELKRAILVVLSFESPQLNNGAMATAFFQCFWTRRIALAYPLQLKQATLSFAKYTDVLRFIVRAHAIKDPSALQGVALNTLVDALPLNVPLTEDKVLEQLCDSLVVCLQSQRQFTPQLVHVFEAFFSSMGGLLGPFIEPLVSQFTGCLNNPVVAQRQLGAALLGSLAPHIPSQTLAGIQGVLLESLDDALIVSPVLDALRAIIKVQPRASHADLLPRLLPVLRNQDDSISQSCIQLIGAIAQASPEAAGAREWMRICAELVEIFKAPRKSVRRLANDTFGHIARAIGPADVLKNLLTSLKLERQSRVNAAVAIAIIADTCGSYAVLPALLNEYRTPDITVQHGTLKALAFLFEYVDVSEYLWSIVGIVDHALLSKNQVSRQTGASLVKFLALSAVGQGHEQVLVHFLNELWPHIFEQSPHVIDRILDAVQTVCLGVGPGAVLPYLWAGLFHSARNTRAVYWRIYNLVYVQSSHAMVLHYPVEVDAFDVWF